ncbi:MAG: hypothetical protein J5627_04210 [Bacilli bacterium]|nr:hypothetical protein [Bacilli bacterium]
MKKGTKLPYLISASLLLVLASCDGGNQPSLTSESSVDLGTSEPETSAIASDASVQGSTLADPLFSSVETSSGRGTYNTTVLGNAFTTSFAKNGMRMVTSQPKVQMGLSTYTVLGADPNYSLMKASTNNFLAQADSMTFEMKKDTSPLAAYGLGGNPDMRINLNNLTVVLGALSTLIPGASNAYNQDANMYFTDDTLYWDFLDENGQECTGLSSIFDLAFTALMETTETEGENEFTFQHKGKYELDSSMSVILGLLTSSSVAESLWTNMLDPMIQSLWEAGADITTTSKSEMGQTVYDMCIKADDPTMFTDTLEETAGDAAGDLVGSMPVDVNSELDNVNSYIDTFDLEMHFTYTRTSLKGMSTSIKATCDEEEMKASLLQEEDIEAGQSKVGLDSIEMSATTVFTFDDNLTVTFPASFDDYVLQEFPEVEEEEPVEEPISSESSEAPASI